MGGFVKVSEETEIVDKTIYRRKPDVNCSQCKGSGKMGRGVCYCVTKKDYVQKESNEPGRILG